MARGPSESPRSTVLRSDSWSGSWHLLPPVPPPRQLEGEVRQCAEPLKSPNSDQPATRWPHPLPGHSAARWSPSRSAARRTSRRIGPSLALASDVARKDQNDGDELMSSG